MFRVSNGKTRHLGFRPTPMNKAASMDYVETKHPSGLGSWLIILGCPRPQSHQLRDEERKVSGPSFAFCASCEHQTGSHFENQDSETGWSLQVYPERLECGYCPDMA